MSTTEEKQPSAQDVPSSNFADESGAANASATKTVGPAWMYRSRKIAGIQLPWYASPEAQLILVSFVCFMCPGMFNAVSGLGAGGQLNAKDVNNANTALYSCFAGLGFFAGSIANTIGLKLTLSFGGFGYFLYVAALLSYNHNQNGGFVIFSGALLGICAGMLWAAQGAVMMSYPNEESKGKFISWFWIIFNLGGVIGALIPLGQNIHSTAGAANDGTYIAFMVLMFFGFLLAWFLVDSKYVQRSDGSHVIVMKNPSWKTELLGLYETIRSDPYIILLFPMFLASNWFTEYQFNGFNLAKFDIRTRALNNVLYWICQMIGAFVFGYALDTKSVRRTVRAKAGLISLLAITMAIWGGGYAWQKGYPNMSSADKPTDTLDWEHGSKYVGPMFLYMFYGFYDAAFQTCVYWFMGSLSNNSRKLANFAGFYKGIQSAGAAITWRLDALHTPYMTQFATTWGLLAGSLVIASPVIFFRIQDTVSIEEDLKFSDETIEDVAPTTMLNEIHEK